MTKEQDDRIDAIHNICKRLETAIQGDEYMGVKGMKQHMEEMNNRMGIHELNDTKQFFDINHRLDDKSESINGKLEQLEDNQKKNKWFMAGVVFVLTTLYALAQIVISARFS